MPKADDDGPSPLQWFLSELDRMPGCERTKRRVVDLLRGMVGQRMQITHRDLVLPQVGDVAAQLLASGFTQVEAASELVARFGYTPRHARRLVVGALHARAKADAIRRVTGDA